LLVEPVLRILSSGFDINTLFAHMNAME